MPKRAVARIEDPETAHDAEVSPEAMAARRAVATRIRARIAKPATDFEVKLWREFEAELEKERPTFRS
jgi:hypothetical protein